MRIIWPQVFLIWSKFLYYFIFLFHNIVVVFPHKSEGSFYIKSKKYIKFEIPVLKWFSLRDWTFNPVNIPSVFILNISFLFFFFEGVDKNRLPWFCITYWSYEWYKGKLDLHKIPHYTTLQKFVSRIPSSLFALFCQEF